MEVLELEEESRQRIAEARTTKIQLTVDLSEENELKHILCQPSTASRGAESQRVTDWVHNCSVVENSNQSQMVVADAGQADALLYI